MIFGGVRIIESLEMVDHVEDWSRVRSPARARRRRRYGHRQNVRTIAVPKKFALSMDGGRTLIMHPEMLRLLRQEISANQRFSAASETSLSAATFASRYWGRSGSGSIISDQVS